MGKIWLGALANQKLLQKLKNMFIVTFAIETNKQRVANDKPWLFDGYLFALQDLDGAYQLVETMINTERFWIQIHNLPFRCMNSRYGNFIRGKIGKVVEIDVNDDNTVRGEYLRIHVEINLSKPLVRG